MKCEEVIRECSYQDLMYFANIDTKTLNVALEVAKNIDYCFESNIDVQWVCSPITNSKSFDIVSLVSKRTFVCRVQDAFQWKMVAEIFKRYHNKLDGYHEYCFGMIDGIVIKFLSKQ